MSIIFIMSKPMSILLSKIEYGIGLLLLIGLYFISIYNYLLFHVVVELFSVIIAFGIFSLMWNGRRFIDNGYYLTFRGSVFGIIILNNKLKITKFCFQVVNPHNF